MEHITEMAACAKEKIGTQYFYCTYTGKMFKSKEELAECFSQKYHNNSYGCCWGCDRREYRNHKEFGLRGLHTKPLMKDPIILVTFSEVPEEFKIKREITE